MTWKLPTVAECDPGIDPFEFQVLVAMAEPEKATRGGVLLPDATVFKTSWGANHARLIAVSPGAFSYHNWPEGVHLPEPGDVVFVGQFPGDEIEGRDGRKYRLCADREIGAVFKSADAQPLKLEQNRAA